MSRHWHLAIESSGLGGSVALFRHDEQYEGELPNQIVLPADQGSVRTLAPAIEKLLQAAECLPADLSSLSVTAGPGSFTGLRVGLTTAKLLAWTAHIPVVPVDTLEAIALRFVTDHPAHSPNLPSSYGLVTAINAFRRQVFTSSWQVRSGQLECLRPAQVMDVDQWLADPWQVPGAPEQPVWVSGSALAVYPGLDLGRYQLGHTDLWQPLAQQVGMLGLRGLATGTAVTAQELAPNYIRASAAEEKRSDKKL